MDSKESPNPAEASSSTVPDDDAGTLDLKSSENNPNEIINANGRENFRNNNKRGARFGGNRNQGGGARRNFGNSGEFRRGGNNNMRESQMNSRELASSAVSGNNSREHGPPRNNREFGGKRQEQGRNPLEHFRENLYEISGPTHELPALDMSEKKFNGRNRLYVGNITSDFSEENLKKIFSEYGEIDDLFMNREKFFAFVTFDYHSNAERAKRELDGTAIDGSDRQMRIRFSPKAATIKVSNLSSSVTNELLYHAFSIFGEIEKAIVLVDERGRSTGIGEVDFTRKKNALQAVKECTDGCFFLTNSLRPCIAELYEPVLNSDGYSEKCIQWKNNEFLKDREAGPWFAKPNSFEFEFGTKWKQVAELFKEREEALKKDLLIEEEKLIAQMGFAKYQYETELLKKQLEEREMYWEQQKLELEKKERMADELRVRNEEELRRREEQIKANVARHEEELKSRQHEASFYRSHDRSYEEHRNSDAWGDTRENYWQRDAAPPPIATDDVVSQESRGRSSFLEEPGQVWKRLDEETLGGNDELFQRRSNRGAENEPSDYGNPKWKRPTWNEDFHYGKRGRF